MPGVTLGGGPKVMPKYYGTTEGGGTIRCCGGPWKREIGVGVTPLLRFQPLERAQARGEATLPASQSGQVRTGGRNRNTGNEATNGAMRLRRRQGEDKQSPQPGVTFRAAP